MKFYIGVTDNSWFRFLAKNRPDEVNFWRPSGRGFGAVPIGAPFLFKLHSPLNFIVGGGFFVRSQVLSLALAWDVFGEKNGADTLTEFRRLIKGKRRDGNLNPTIGCVILHEPFFLPENQWIPTPADWKPNIVSGKTYSTSDRIGAQIWSDVLQRLPMAATSREEGWQAEQLAQDGPLFGNEYLARARLGQSMFRLQVIDAYDKKCAMSGEKALPVLQAAHIKPVAESGPNRTENGLLLRSDLHILFDKGYITVTPAHRIEVSRRIKEEYDNGQEYYRLHGRALIVLPQAALERPASDFLDWHNREVFLG